MRFGFNWETQLTMKSKHIYLLILIAWTSCTKPNLYQLKINDIPTKAPNYNIELRFASNKLPINPYFEIIDYDIVEKGAMSKMQIKKRLELEAIKEGVDAIIDIDYWTETNKEVNFFTVILDVLDEDYEPTTMQVNYTHITGRGIMYLDNLDFIDHQAEYEYFYQQDTEIDLPVPLFKIEYKLTGQVYKVYPENDDALDIYKKYFQFYSDFHLLKQRERWIYKMNGPLLKKRTLLHRKGRVNKRCFPKYDEDNRLVQLKIIHFYSNIDHNEYIKYAYDEKGRLIKRIVEIYDGTVVLEEYNYNEDKLAGKKISIQRPSEEPIKINTSIHYYHPNYLKDYYFNEYVKTMQN